MVDNGPIDAISALGHLQPSSRPKPVGISLNCALCIQLMS